MTRILPLALLLPVLWLGCSDEEEAPMAPESQAPITVGPSSPEVLVGESVQLTASGPAASGGVTWSLERFQGSPNVLGTITEDGLYTAPERLTDNFDYQVVARATSKNDTTLSAFTVILVPKIVVRVSPSDLGSVPPGTLVPYSIEVLNSPQDGFRLFVEGVEGGNPLDGTFTQTGPASAVYQAPTVNFETRTISLLVKSTFDSLRFAFPTITVRRGQPMEMDVVISQFAPDWKLDQNVLAFVEGPPWKLVVFDLDSRVRSEIADVDWMGTTYDGRLSWSGDGTQIAFSEMIGGRHTVSLIDANGGAVTPFDPDGMSEFYEAVFWPDGNGSDSLVVATNQNGFSALRIFDKNDPLPTTGQALYAAPSGLTARYPDATVFEGELLFGTIAGNTSRSQIDSIGMSGNVTLNAGNGSRSQFRWTGVGRQVFGSFIFDDDQAIYRVPNPLSSSAIRLFGDFYPQHSFDMTNFTFGQFAISRQEPDGIYRIWIVEGPGPDFAGLSRSAERELESMGIRGAIRPHEWGRWMGDQAYQPLPAVNLR